MGSVYSPPPSEVPSPLPPYPASEVPSPLPPYQVFPSPVPPSRVFASSPVPLSSPVPFSSPVPLSRTSSPILTVSQQHLNWGKTTNIRKHGKRRESRSQDFDKKQSRCISRYVPKQQYPRIPAVVSFSCISSSLETVLESVYHKVNRMHVYMYVCVCVYVCVYVFV